MPPSQSAPDAMEMRVGAGWPEALCRGRRSLLCPPSKLNRRSDGRVPQTDGPKVAGWAMKFFRPLSEHLGTESDFVVDPMRRKRLEDGAVSQMERLRLARVLQLSDLHPAIRPESFAM